MTHLSAFLTVLRGVASDSFWLFRESVLKMENLVVAELLALASSSTGSGNLLCLLQNCRSLRVMRRPRLATALQASTQALLEMYGRMHAQQRGTGWSRVLCTGTWRMLKW